MDNFKLRTVFAIYSSLEDAMKLKLHQSIHFEMRFCMVTEIKISTPLEMPFSVISCFAEIKFCPKHVEYSKAFISDFFAHLQQEGADVCTILHTPTV